MTSQLRHCGGGPSLGKSQLSEPLEANDSTPSQTCNEPLATTNQQNRPRKRSRSATPELAQYTNKGTSNDRLQPFWNGYTQEESRRWWLPERTSCATLDRNSWSGSLQSMGLNSWYSVLTSMPVAAKQKTFSPSPRCLWRDIMGYALPPIAKKDRKLPKKPRTSKKMTTEEKPPAGKARRIRLFPTHEERQRFRGWMGAMRWTYNRCLVATEKEGVKKCKKDL